MIAMTAPQYRRHECTIDGRKEHFWPHCAEVLATLLVSNPDRFICANSLIESLWPNPDLEPDYAKSIIQRAICLLRRNGVPIESDGTFGYRIPRWAREDTQMAEAA